MKFKEIKVFDNYMAAGDTTRLYYSVRTYDGTKEEKVGFDFIALDCVGYPCGGKNEYNFSPESKIEVVVEGIALFDGVRHLYYGNEKTNNYGYHYYPNLLKVIKVLIELKKLEETYCKDYN